MPQYTWKWYQTISNDINTVCSLLNWYYFPPFFVFIEIQEVEIENLEEANERIQSDLKLAFKRIADLQGALEDNIGSDESDLGRWEFIVWWSVDVVPTRL